MNSDQFSKLIEKLEEIRCGIIDLESELQQRNGGSRAEINTGYNSRDGYYVSVDGHPFCFQKDEDAKLFHAKLLLSR